MQIALVCTALTMMAADAGGTSPSARAPLAREWSPAVFDAPARQQPDRILPSEALYLMLREMRLHPDRPRRENTQRFYERTITTSLDDTERFALAEVSFVNFMPAAAKAIYATFQDGTDIRARVAGQRILQILFAAEDRHAEVESRLAAYRRRFAPAGEDPFHLYQQVANLADLYAGRGDHARVVALVTEEVESLPLDAPFLSFTLPGRFIESFDAVGKRSEARAMLVRARDALQALLRTRERRAPARNLAAEAFTPRLGVFARMEFSVAQYHPEFDQLRDNFVTYFWQTVVTRLDEYLAARP